MGLPYVAQIIIAVSIASLIVYWAVKSILNCFLEAGQLQAFAIKEGADITEIVLAPKFHFSLFRRVVRGSERARDFEIPYYDTKLNQMIALPLLDPRSGAITLRGASVCLRDIAEETQDNHAIKIDAELRFNLDKDRLIDCFKARRFGDGLTRYFGFIVRSVVAGKTKNDVESNVGAIREEILKEMQEYGMTRGFSANNVLIHTVRDRGKYGEITPIDSGAERYGGGYRPESTEIISEEFLRLIDLLRDLLRPKEENIDRELLLHANNALLEILRIRGQEIVARELAKSNNNLIVVTAQELGLAESAIPRNHMKFADFTKPGAEQADGGVTS